MDRIRLVRRVDLPRSAAASRGIGGVGGSTRTSQQVSGSPSMTGEPAGGHTGELTFRLVTGELVGVIAVIDGADSHTGEFLITRTVQLDNGTELRQLRVAPGPDRGTGYERLDNEILAGRRLHEVTEGVDYPAAVSRLYGDEAASADPYALLEPYRGEPLQAAVRQMGDDEQHAFEVSLLTGLCWLEAAGIAHRGLSPSTVRWDGPARQTQITDFSLCTVFGVPREAIGPPEWAGPEQRPGRKVDGLVTRRDDMYAAARLIYYVRSQGEILQSRDQLAEIGLTDLEQVFAPPDNRPTARELLADRLAAGDPVPQGIGSDPRLKHGHERFDLWRREKHPGVGEPEDLRGADAGITGSRGDAAGPSDRANSLRASPGSAQAAPVMAEPATPREPADRGKRSWWRWGGRS